MTRGVEELITVLQSRLKIAQRRQQKPKQRQQTRKSLYRRLSHYQQCEIVKLQQLPMSCYCVAKQLRISSSTVYSVVRRFSQRGAVSDHRHRSGRPMTQESKQILDFIRDKQILQDWAYLSLRERCGVILHNLGIAISPGQLCRLYKKIGVGYRCPQKVYLTVRRTEHQLQLKRIEYAITLARIVISEQPLIYMDETTFNSYMRQSKTWMYADCAVQFFLSPRRFSGVTLFGAIGNCLKEPVYLTAQSTTIETFKEFLTLLATSLSLKTDTKPFLVLDNHPAHTSKKARDLLLCHFQPLWLPPQTCQFNSIERLWALIKRVFKQQAGLQVDSITQQSSVVKLVEHCATMVSSRVIANVMSANRKFLVSQLISGRSVPH